MNFILLFAAIVMGAMLIVELNDVLHSAAAARWKSTAEHLKEWDIHWDVDSENSALTIRNIQYSYTVGPKEYSSSRLGFGFPRRMGDIYFGMRERTLNSILGHAPDVTAFYDPANPAQSALSVGIQPHHRIRMELLLFFTLILFLLHTLQ